MPLSRRRFISIAAASSAAVLVPRAAPSARDGVSWEGQALGASVSIRVQHDDHAAAERLIARSVQEINRLEQLFSLYRAESALTELNRRGVLVAPPSDMVALLAACRRFCDATRGAFDPTVQPLWLLYHAHFARAGADPDGPAPDQIADARARVGLHKIRIEPDRIAFGQRGMAVTLNGIAQGFITDRVTDLLRAGGIAHCLVDIGEGRAVGSRPDGRPWQVGVADPKSPKRIAETVDLVDLAISTSGGYGFAFDAAGRFNHLFDPRTGLSPSRYAGVTVVAPTATAADALSTAFCAMAPDEIRSTLRTLGYGRVLLSRNGERAWLTG